MMTAMIATHLAPFDQTPIPLDAPPRRGFTIFGYKSLRSAIKLLLKHRREPELRQAEKHYNRGLKAHSIGHFQEAEEHYRTCIELQEEHEPAHTNLAALYVQRNSADLAEVQLRHALKSRPRYYRGYYNLGVLLNYLNRQDEAMEQLKKALELKPDYPWTYITMAEIENARNHHQAAIDHYESALQHDPESTGVHRRLAELYFLSKDYANAEAHLRKALELRSNAIVSYNLAWVLSAQGDTDHLEEASELLREAESQRKGFQEATFNQAMIYSKIGEGDLSVKKMMRYVQEYVGNEDEDLIEHLNFLILVNPRNDAAYLMISKLYLAANHTQKAIETLQSVLEIDPECLTALQALARCYFEMGRYKDAIHTYRNLIKVAPEEVSGYLGLTKAYGAVENYAAALPVIEKVLTLDPNNAQLHYEYATLMAQNGDFNVAYKHYKRVAQLDPNFPRIQKRIKMLEEELDDAEEPQPWPKRRTVSKPAT